MSQKRYARRLTRLIFWLMAVGCLWLQASSIVSLRFERALILRDSATEPLILSQSIAAFGDYELRVLLAPDGEYARLLIRTDGRCHPAGSSV